MLIACAVWAHIPTLWLSLSQSDQVSFLFALNNTELWVSTSGGILGFLSFCQVISAQFIVQLTLV